MQIILVFSIGQQKNQRANIIKLSRENVQNIDMLLYSLMLIFSLQAFSTADCETTATQNSLSTHFEALPCRYVAR